MTTIHQVHYVDDVPLTVARSNVLMEGFREVDEATWEAARAIVEAPPVVGPMLPTISDRQFFQAMASAPYRLISETEAEDAVATGTIPAVMMGVVDGLPTDQRFAVRMLLRGATTFERANPLVEIFGASQGMDGAAIDTFWRFAAGL